MTICFIYPIIDLDYTLQPGYSLRTFTGHAATVMSLDFHPSKDDLIFSCDNSEIRYWSIKNGSCAGVFKVRSLNMNCKDPNILLPFAVNNLIFQLSGWCNSDEISTLYGKASCSCSR